MTSAEKCPVCGKKGKRPCPALGGTICPACCGSQRGSKIQCPSECAFFPLGAAGYDLWLQIDGSWMDKTFKYVRSHLGESETLKIMRQHYVDQGNEEVNQFAALSPALYYAFCVRRDAQGQTLADRWESEGWAGLNNDEKLMMSYRRRSFVTVIEIQKLLDHQSFLCLDLLEPGSPPFVVLDRLTAHYALRFTRLQVWLTHYPHFSRIGGIGFEIGEIVWSLWHHEIERLVNDASKERPELNKKQYLAENWAQSGMLTTYLAEIVRQHMMESVDAHRCAGIYELKDTVDAVKSVLDTHLEFLPTEAPASRQFPNPLFFYRIIHRDELARAEGEQPNLETAGLSDDEQPIASIRLFQDRLILEAISVAAYKAGKERLDQLFGPRLAFQTESIVNLAKEIAERRALASEWEVATGTASETPQEPEGEGLGIAPDLQQKLLAKAHHDHYERFLTNPLAALDGKSPREAAADVALRPKVVEMMKNHVHLLERNNRNDGTDLSLDWVLDELGLSELK